MFRYRFDYIDSKGEESIDHVEAIGLSEAVDTFIDTFCPVASIESVLKLKGVDGPIARERQTP